MSSITSVAMRDKHPDQKQLRKGFIGFMLLGYSSETRGRNLEPGLSVIPHSIILNQGVHCTTAEEQQESWRMALGGLHRLAFS